MTTYKKIYYGPVFWFYEIWTISDVSSLVYCIVNVFTLGGLTGVILALNW